MPSDHRRPQDGPPPDERATLRPTPAGPTRTPATPGPPSAAPAPPPWPGPPAAGTAPGGRSGGSAPDWRPPHPSAPAAPAAPADDGAAAVSLLATTQVEYEQISAELQEVRGAIRAMSLSFDQANLQRVESAAHVREMEEHMETFSRQEIRARYLESARAEMRAFMLVQERERLQDKEQALARHQGSLRHAVDVLSTLPLGAPGAPAAAFERATGTADRPAALGRSIRAEEDVRQRVARHLHDGPAQALANVVLTAEVCEKLVQSDPPRARSELGTLKSHVGTALQDIRKFIFELRPMTLDDLGLVPTLRRYIGDLGARYRIQIVLAVPNGERRLAPPAELALFRISQEAISNAVEHSQATLVRLTLALGSDALVLTVEDNGVGFDVEQALAFAAARRTFGIASMQERAESLGGWLRIESAFGQGSRVEVRVPAR